MTEPLDLAEEWVYQVWQRGDMEFAAQLCAENYTDFTVPDNDEGDCVAFQNVVREVRAAFPDLKAEVVDSFQDQDYIILRILFIGTHESDYFDFAPTHQRVEWESIDILHFGDEKLLERWAQNDLLIQLQESDGEFGELQRAESHAELIGQLADAPRQLRDTIRVNGVHSARENTLSTQATVGHLWRVERSVWQTRLQQLANDENPYWDSIESDLIQAETDFGASDVNVLLDAYEFLRNATCEYLRALDAEGWTRRGTDRTTGELDVAGLMAQAVEYDRVQLAALNGAQL